LTAVRIAIVSEYARPWPGGISEHVHHETRELRRRGHEVAVVTGPADPCGHPEPGVLRLRRELRFTSNGALSRATFGPELLRLGQLFGRLRPDVVHVHAPLDPLLGLAAALASPVPTAGTFHASFQPAPTWQLLYGALRPLTGAAFRRLRARIAVSPEARRSIARYFPGEYRVVPNGVDVERFGPAVEPLPVTGGGPTILFVGRADPRKGLAVLLDAFSRVHARLPRARLRLVVPGGASAVSGLVGRLDAVVRGAVEVEGYVAPELLPRCYAGCDVFCSPATGGESQGIVLLEAMASARPVVASDIPGYRDVVADGREGILVGPGDAERLADALARLLDDPAARSRMGQAGRETALVYAWPTVAARLEAIFCQALEAAA
jgi:phosphatidylinositol alpha-mannosyltransferase